MTTVDDTRTENLRALVDQEGSQRLLADKIGKAPAQISQWLTRAPNSRTGTPRAIHRTSAREIEQALGLPDGWMDKDHSVANGKSAIFDAETLEDALLVIRNVYLAQGEEPGFPTAREIELAYRLVEDSAQGVSVDNIVTLVRTFLHKQGERDALTA